MMIGVNAPVGVRSTHHPRTNAKTLGPGEPRDSAGARLVLAADEASIAEPIDGLEHGAVIEFTPIGLATVWRIGELHMADEGQELLDATDDVTTHHLAMVDVELQPEVDRPDLVNRAPRVLAGLEKIARHVATVDRFDHDAEARCRSALCCPLQARDIGPPIGAVMEQARHHMDLRGAKRQCIADRLFYRSVQLLLSAGKTG